MHKLLELHSRPPTEKARAALRRLSGLHSLAESGEWYADLLYKIFADCDVGLFGGRLMGQVYLTYFHPDVEKVVLLSPAADSVLRFQSIHRRGFFLFSPKKHKH